MAKLFTLASWNVEHFQDEPTRVDRVVRFLRDQQPDVFALYEVEGKTVFNSLTSLMPEWQFHITEGPQTQEILVGVRKTVTAFFTQRVEFKSGVTLLRPGALVSLRFGPRTVTLLFLHTKSSSTPLGLGLRDDMFQRALEFRDTLDKAAGKPADYLFLGDLNTMGMKYPFDKTINAATELQKLDQQAARKRMRRLPKTHETTWWNGTASLPPSNLDHVIAADHLKFKAFHQAAVDVRGWVRLPTLPEQRQWIQQHSDHNLLFLQMER